MNTRSLKPRHVEALEGSGGGRTTREHAQH
jgi:hypothetical protein